jgi:hypothetical protein
MAKTEVWLRLHTTLNYQLCVCVCDIKTEKNHYDHLWHQVKV